MLPSYCSAQTVITSSSVHSKGSSGTTSSSIGQVFYSLHQSPYGFIVEGVQQPKLVSDSDGDGVLDKTELSDGTDPKNPCSLMLESQTEVPDSSWITGDCDQDSVSNGFELLVSTNLFKKDSDGDGVSDYKEIMGMSDPLDPCEPPQNIGYQGFANHDSIWRVADCDHDTLLNGVEDSLMIDPYNNDTDGDGLLDYGEIYRSSNPLNPCDPNRPAGYSGFVDTNTIWQAADCDSDTLTNLSEYEIGTDPYQVDTDGDGWRDNTEIAILTNPLDACEPSPSTSFNPANPIWFLADCDQDQVLNGIEDSLGTSAYLPDTDGDGILDSFEIYSGMADDALDPCLPVQLPGYSAFDSTSTTWQMADCDLDTLLNSSELSVFADPYSPDTDGDGLQDNSEVLGNYDPINPCDPNRPASYSGYNAQNIIWQAADCDGDSLHNSAELTAYTNPYAADTDGDGLSDGQEIMSNSISDPTDPCDPFPADTYTSFDPSNVTWQMEDCDGDGATNLEEFLDSSGIYLPCDPPRQEGYSGYSSTNEIWQQADCDGDMLSNAFEDSLKADPYATNSNLLVFGKDSLIANGSQTANLLNLTNFGERNLNAVSRHHFKIKNGLPDANGPLELGPEITLINGDGSFTIAYKQDCVLLPGESGTLIIRFQPKTAGCQEATVQIPHNDPNQIAPFSFVIKGRTKGATCTE